MFSSLSGVAFVWHLHLVFVFTAFVGGILFLSWAMKLKPDQLKKWVQWLLIIGVLGTLLTAGASLQFWSMIRGGKMMSLDGRGSWNMMGGEGMMDFDEKTIITPGERALNR